MNADVLTTRLADGIAVITLGSARRIYVDAEMGDALTEALERFAGDTNVRVVVVTGGAPGYFIRHLTVAALIRLAESVAYIKRLVRNATETHLAQGLALERNLFLKLCITEPALARMRSYEEAKISSPSGSIVVEQGA